MVGYLSVMEMDAVGQCVADRMVGYLSVMEMDAVGKCVTD
jgi:hypothetical protein